ncbi:ATP-dependent DNA helicase RecG [Syntrophotalea carbinolica DSM 2380]|uniref:ATP-dependent DNA helicase RecG n=1 Tax=Syntrophotalea carbinolica (strain DSM 2380 / NBRC 103641 / GraBd1) TaxID=338963 RepID=Q3A454_SYNC1|nr:ATP-dependent DNA helicase RecG [Syntrophotalea carbinolica]ABA88853.1 ATP-dependent DNA helicase RecG [Syntrophotalea carbinolica DSM 2380]
MSLKPTYKQCHEFLGTPLDTIRGVGPRLVEKFAKMGVFTVEHALYTLPFRYEDRRRLTPIAQLKPDCKEIFVGEVLAASEKTTSRSRRKLFEVIVGDSSGSISLKWFHYRKTWIQKQYPLGRRGIFYGEVKRFGAIREIHHPDVDFLREGQDPQSLLESDPLSFGRILPVYPLTEGLTQKTIRKIWKQIVDRYAEYVVAPLPDEIRKRQNLMPLSDALRRVHFPSSDSSLKELEEGMSPARRTLVFDELFYLELGMALKRRGVLLEEGHAFKLDHIYTKPLAGMLPFRLTEAQRRVLGEIKRDMMSPHPMNRLLQGDVGSGKTVVALMAALVAIENRTQVAVVAPTEILAEQHFFQFQGWMKALGLGVVFLTGSTPTAQRREILQQLKNSTVDMVVGTHAVLQDDVEFAALGLGIIDEQHRFGVLQRACLRKKGKHPDLLVMTATPIPRTLALTVYGDLALSVIDQMPPGRQPVNTKVIVDQQRRQAYQTIRNELVEGRQAYIVYPLVEETEKSDLMAATEGAEFLQEKVFPDKRIGVLHGKMRPADKEAIMRCFKAGELDILVSTTVIEVGIDVPNATVMMIEHAERFGLAQLHQLRGRVGRGQHQSYCLLIRSHRCSEDGLRRLDVMEATTDGFKIAEADLEIRGPGEFLGTRQSGLPDFRVANLIRDGRILEQARQEAFSIANDPGFLTSDHYAELRQALKDRWGDRLELASLG